MTKPEFDILYNETVAQYASDEGIKFDFLTGDGSMDILPRLAIQQFINQLTPNADLVRVRSFDARYDFNSQGKPNLRLNLEIEIISNTTV